MFRKVTHTHMRQTITRSIPEHYTLIAAIFSFHCRSRRCHGKHTKPQQVGCITGLARLIYASESEGSSEEAADVSGHVLQTSTTDIKN